MTRQELFPRTDATYRGSYGDALGLVERLHRLMLDVLKDEFERLGTIGLNPVQTLLLYNVGDDEVTPGELRSRGYYQGSNVSYNLKRLVDAGYMHHQRCAVDRRSVRVSLTEAGREVHDMVDALFTRHAAEMERRGVLDHGRLDDLNGALRRVERFWSDQIRYIY